MTVFLCEIEEKICNGIYYDFKLPIKDIKVSENTKNGLKVSQYDNRKTDIDILEDGEEE